MKTVFADSFYFFALANPHDPAHARAVTFVQTFTGRIVTTGWVLTELADGWASPTQRTFLVPLLAKLRANPNARIEPCTDQLLQAGIGLRRGVAAPACCSTRQQATTATQHRSRAELMLAMEGV